MNKTLIIICIVCVVCVAYVLFVMALAFFQEYLMYPGRYREQSVISESFRQIDKSYYKKGISNKLWVICGGNYSIPQDYVKFTEGLDHSWLLVNYPGYPGNENEHPNPETMSKNIRKCLEKLKEYKHINFLGYSIGTAVTLNYLEKYGPDHPVETVILLAPFYSIDEIIYSKFLVPRIVTQNLLNHNWNNYEAITKLPVDINLTIAHGKNDEVVNYEQSIQLHELIKDKIHTKLILTEDDHMSVCRLIPELIK